MTLAQSRLAMAAVFLMTASGLPGLGCALLSRGSSVDLRWYTPELVRSQPGSAERQPGCELRLGRVKSGTDLGRFIAYSDGLHEIGYYESRRWTERPEAYVRRAVERALFEDGSFQRALTGAAPTLDIEVVEFEEVKAPTTHAARIALRVALSSTDRVVLERTVAVSEPVPGGDFDGFVAAMSGALNTTASEIARAVSEARPEDEACPGR
jgi:cholesterol transport system auxiliary component